MKGKHGQRAAGRRERKDQETIERQASEIRDLKHEVAGLRRRLAEQDGYDHELARLRGLVAANTSDAFERLSVEHAALKAQASEMLVFVNRVRQAYDKAIFRAVCALGGGSPALELLCEILNEDEDEDLKGGAVSIIQTSYEAILPLEARRARRRKEEKHNPRTLKRTVAALAERNLLPSSLTGK